MIFYKKKASFSKENEALIILNLNYFSSSLKTLVID